MTPERGQKLYAVFEAALACAPAERAALLEDVCAGDPELRAEVERLLVQDADAERDRFLATPVSTDGEAPRHDMSTEKDLDFDPSRNREGTGDETPFPAALLPPGLAELSQYAIRRKLRERNRDAARFNGMPRHGRRRELSGQAGIGPRPESLPRPETNARPEPNPGRDLNPVPVWRCRHRVLTCFGRIDQSKLGPIDFG